jgi:putative FmdB family regulatory protein
MPIYEYECTSCCKVIEVIQRMTENPLTNCPDCSGPVNKLVSKSSFQLKGGGWYADGYSSKSSNGSGSTSKDKSTKDKLTKNTSTKAEKTTSRSSDSAATTKSKADCSATA